jgi:excisionase family DNA binding protein
MSAYATSEKRLTGRLPEPTGTKSEPGSGNAAAVDELLAQPVERIAAAVVERLAHNHETSGDEWLDSRHAAVYLGVHRDTLRRLAAERAIPSEQDGRGCKLYFRRSDLDDWRRGGGGPRHLGATLRPVA